MNSFGGFLYGDDGICLNPERVSESEWDDGADFYFSIAVAQSGAGWVDDVKWHIRGMSGGHECRFGCQGGQTRSQAIVYAAQHLKAIFKLESAPASAIIELERIISAESDSQKPTGYQYSIFDYL